jgi:hypothetical protein
MSNQVLWSKGPFITPYSKLDTEQMSSTIKIIQIIKSSNGILWIRNSSQSKNVTDLDIVASYIYLINKPTILITSDGDRPVPSSYNTKTITTILNNKYITKWYTQNYDRTILHSKINHIPIGFDFHTEKWLINNSKHDKFSFMQNCRKGQAKIKNLIFTDMHLSKTHIEREHIYELIKNNKNMVFLDSLKSFIEITKLYNKYLFAISPRGSGLDCHRTWELLMAGCIVITRTSSLDTMYINNNLPVVILQDWNELNLDIENKLKRWEKEHIHKTNINNIYSRLMYSYWIN